MGDEKSGRSELREDMRRLLAEELRRPGRSQTGLAKFLRVNQSAVSRMVSGERRIKADEWAQIQDWLRLTDLEHRRAYEAEVDALPPEAFAVSQPSPLVSFPDVYRKLTRRALLEPYQEGVRLPGNDSDSDYPSVMVGAARLEVHLAYAVHDMHTLGSGTELAPWPAWDRPAEKIAALVAAGRINQPVANSALAVLALRDAFAHSGVVLTLGDEDIRPIIRAILPGLFEEEGGSAGDGTKYLRALFSLAASTLAFAIVNRDPTDTSKELLAMVDSIESPQTR